VILWHELPAGTAPGDYVCAYSGVRLPCASSVSAAAATAPA
jgi:hypothetical protein